VVLWIAAEGSEAVYFKPKSQRGWVTNVVCDLGLEV
jgi:hypothetical protein